MVGAMGCSGDTNRYGWPSESFVIDGVASGIETVPTGLAGFVTTVYFNVTFFTSPALDPGEHTIVLTNLNGTVPNTLCFDRFWYISTEDVVTRYVAGTSLRILPFGWTDLV